MPAARYRLSLSVSSAAEEEVEEVLVGAAVGVRGAAAEWIADPVATALAEAEEVAQPVRIDAGQLRQVGQARQRRHAGHIRQLLAGGACCGRSTRATATDRPGLARPLAGRHLTRPRRVAE